MKTAAALLMLGPAVVFLLLSFVGPLLMMGYLSLFDTNYVMSKFVGLGNFADLAQDRHFLRSLANSFWYVVFIVPACTAISYFVALLLGSVGKRAAGMGRFAFYIPGLTAGIIISLLWRWIYAREGPANWLLGRLGFGPVGWYSDAWAARVAISIVIVFISLGSYILVFYANLSSISKDLRDAAQIDGASDSQYTRFIVAPLMLPSVLLVSLLAMIGAMQVWETIYVMTNGGPAGYTSTPIFDIYLTAFQNSHYGLAAAKSVVAMAIISGTSWLKRRIEKWAVQ